MKDKKDKNPPTISVDELIASVSKGLATLGNVVPATPSPEDEDIDPLPLESAADLISKFVNQPSPGEIIHGVLRMGDLAVYGGGAKIKKTWFLMQLALAVASGSMFLGLSTFLSRVVFINLELPGRDFGGRMKWVLSGEPCPPNISTYSHRDNPGSPGYLEMLLKRIKKTPGWKDVGLYIFDPLYQCIDAGSENNPESMHAAMDLLIRFAKESGAAVLVSHHFPKGDRTGHRHFDRMSGSSILSRAPDTLITASAHSEEDCFALDFTTRHFRDPKAMVMRWKSPRFVVANALSPTSLFSGKQGSGKQGRKKNLMALIVPEGIKDIELNLQAINSLDISKSTYHTYLTELTTAGKIEKRGDSYFPLVESYDEAPEPLFKGTPSK